MLAGKSFAHAIIFFLLTVISVMTAVVTFMTADVNFVLVVMSFAAALLTQTTQVRRLAMTGMKLLIAIASFTPAIVSFTLARMSFMRAGMCFPIQIGAFTPSALKAALAIVSFPLASVLLFERLGSPLKPGRELAIYVVKRRIGMPWPVTVAMMREPVSVSASLKMPAAPLSESLKGHPHFMMPDGFIEVVECMAIPGM